MKEEWRPVVGFPGYFVSNLGSVISERSGKPHVLAQNTGRKGYKYVYLRRDNKTHGLFVHRLVLGSFLGPCPKGRQCDHINAIRSDNRLENLRWVTQSENMRNPITRSRLLMRPAHVGGKRKMVSCLDTGEVFGSVTDAAKKYGLRIDEVSKVCRGSRRKTGGLHFKFV